MRFSVRIIIFCKLHSAVSLKFTTQFCVRPLERPPPLYGAQDGDSERGGVQEEGGGCVLLIVWEERGTERDTHREREEREEGDLFLMGIQRTQRKRDAHWETNRAGKEVETYFTHGKKQENE